MYGSGSRDLRPNPEGTLNSREKGCCFGLGHPRLNPEGTFKVFCKADEGLCLAVRGGALVLATADPTDEHQHWFKDVRFSLRIKDEEGKPVFSLINKATGFAIQHSLGPGHPVRLVKFNPEDFEESVLWTESGHLGRDFGRIRMLYDVDLCLDALPCNEDGGGVQDGTAITLTERAEGDTQSWKILYWSDEANETCGGLYNEPTCRIYCKANMGFSLTVRNGTICLVPTDINDKYQEWIEDTRLGDMIRDQEGYPAFALINYATGHAIHASAGHGNHVLELKPYNPTYVDEFRLWTKSRDMGEGFRCIHMLGNISLNFDAFQVDKDHGGVRDDTKLMLSYWTEENNLQLLWRITPWCKSPYSTHFTTIAGCPEQCKSPYESTFH